MNRMGAVIGRDLAKAFRQQSEVLHPLLFFTIAVSLFPFALGADAEQMRAVAPGLLWVCVLLAASLSLDGVFRSEIADGSIEIIALSGIPLSTYALAKACAHWLTSFLAIILISLPIGSAMQLSVGAMQALFITLLLGTPTLSLVGVAISALTVDLRNAGMLLALLILPLYIPVLIIGSSATMNGAAGLPFDAELYFLGGLLVLAVTLTPAASAAAIRIRLG